MKTPSNPIVVARATRASTARPTPRSPFGRRSHHRGGAVLETALVMSILAMLGLGAAEYGYAFYVKHALMTAAAVGARTGILPTSTDAALAAAISNQLALTNMKNIQYTVTTVPTSVTNCSKGTTVDVTITCTWGNVGITPLPVCMGGLSATKQLSASASMIHE